MAAAGCARVSRRLLLFFLLIAACSNGPDADLPSISEARSLAAEWALVNEQAGEGRLSAAYVDTMRDSVRKELGTTAGALTRPDSRYGEEIRALLIEPADAAPEALRAHADTLKRIEDSLESA
jgi:hypothetical protein